MILDCTDYKIVAKHLSNRMKKHTDYSVHQSQTYCIPDHFFPDHYFYCDIIELAKVQELNVGMLSIDQGKAFDRVEEARADLS